MTETVYREPDATAWRWAGPVLRCVLVAGALVLALGVWAAQSLEIRLENGEYGGRIAVPLNKSETLRLDSTFAEVLVGSSEIADVLPLTDRSIYVLGKRPGTTNISIIDRNKRLLGVIDVDVTADTGLIQSKIRESTGNPNITVTDSNGSLVLAGSVTDAPTVDRAIQIASQFAPGQVVNALNVHTSQQVMLKVRFVEAQRNAGRELGIRWDGRGNSGNFRSGREDYPAWESLDDGEVLAYPPGSAPLLQLLTPLATSGGTPFGVALATLVNDGFNIDGMIQALEQRGLGRRLAEPNLVAMSGDTADFLAGGEFPVPVRGGDGEVSIEYKEFGVGLAFTPTVLKDGQINLKIEPEVSQLDFTNAVQSGGVAVPALTTRRANTTIELRNGQSFAIAGLLQTDSRREIQQLPWIGSIPVIGALFRSTGFINRETDLVIIVTPHLVEPGAPGQRIATPLDNTIPTNDVDLFLMGKLELQKDYRHWVETGAEGDIRGPYGHMLELSYGNDGVVTKQ